MKIEELLNKYFEGETSCQEEQVLREYFTSGQVDDQLKVYIPLFSYFEEEIRKESSPTLTQPVHRQKRTWQVAGIAASLLILVVASIGQWVSKEDPCLCGNYVVVNGRCYTDPHKIREYVWKSLQDVAVPAENYIGMDEEEYEKAIIEKQFSELGDLFSDDF